MPANEPTYIYEVVGDIVYMCDSNFRQLWKMPLLALDGRFGCNDLPDDLITTPSVNFFNLPVGISIQRHKAAIVGVPYGKGSLNVVSHSGLFPQYLRQTSTRYPVYIKLNARGTSGLYDVSQDRYLFKGLSLRDLGDLQISDEKSISQAIWQLLGWHIKYDSTLFVIGGDHSITYHFIHALASKRKRDLVAVIFDAHHDGGVSFSGFELNHANFVSHLVEIPEVRHVLQIGLRSLRSPSQLYRHRKVQQLPVSKLSKETFTVALSRALEDARNPLVYLSIDLDCLDPLYFPHVDFPVPDGLQPKQLEEYLRLIFSMAPTIPVIDIVEGSIKPSTDETYPAHNGDVPLSILACCLDCCHLRAKTMQEV